MDSVKVSVVGPVLNLEVFVRGWRRRLGLVAIATNVEFYTLSGVVRVLRSVRGRGGWGWRRRRLPVASLFVDTNLFTELLRRLSGVGPRGLLELLGRRLGTTEALFFVDAHLFLDVSVVLVVLGASRRRGWRRRVVNGGGEGFVDFFVTFPSV